MKRSSMHDKRYLILTALALVVCAACWHRTPTTKQYQKDGIKFSYNSDWTVSKDAPIEDNPTARSIRIDGPNHALLMLICTPPSNTQTLKGFADIIAENRGRAIEGKLSFGPLKPAEVNKGSSATTTGVVAGKQQDGIRQLFTIDLLGVKVPTEAVFFLVNGQTNKVFIMSQVATEHTPVTHPGSELIISTLSVD